MSSLNDKIKVENLEIDSNISTVTLYNTIIKNKKLLKIKFENENIKIKVSSIQKIFSLNEENLLQNILFIYDKNNLNIDNENEEKLLNNSMNLEIQNIPSNQKYECLIPYIYLIISLIFFIHLLTFIFSSFFIVNIYVIICVILSEIFFSLSYFYYEKINVPECFNLHFKYVKPLHIYSIVFILMNIVILIFPFFSGKNLSRFIGENKINFILTYCFVILPSFITNYFQLYFLKGVNHENGLKEIVTNELSIIN